MMFNGWFWCHVSDINETVRIRSKTQHEVLDLTLVVLI